MKRVLWGLLVVSLVAMVMSCGSKNVGPETNSDAFGRLSMKLSSSAPPHDVAAVDVKVVGASDGCDATPIQERTTKLETQPIEGHYFADALFVLLAGNYNVCATPVQTDGKTPSEYCSPAVYNNVLVSSEATLEILLISQCKSDPNGGLDVITVLNDAPVITDLNIAPGKFITACGSATIKVTASDPNGDPLHYDWSFTPPPPPGSIVPNATGETAVFTVNVLGSYIIKVVVSDILGGVTSLSFPIHVMECVCQEGQTDCSGTCVNLSSDPANCGSCNNVCPRNEDCAEGSCSCLLTLCGTGTAAVCTNTDTDPEHCGSCDKACGSNQTCTGGQCVCSDPNLTLCGGVCVDTTSDHDNCSKCSSACQAQESCCSSTCTDITTSPNCGKCGNSCGQDQICTGGTCVTPLYFGNYDFPQGFVKTTTLDPDNLTGYAIPVSVTTSITIYKLGFIAFSSGDVKAGVYSDTGGNPDALIAQISSQALNGTPSGDRREFDVVSPTSIGPGTYWFMAVYDSSVTVGVNGASGPVKGVSQTFSNPLPSPFPSPTTQNNLQFNYYIVGW